jgi:hypothetical protein
MEEKPKHLRFWAPGHSFFRDELRKEEAQRLALLKVQMKEVVDPGQKEEIRKRIAEIKAEYNRKRKNARESMFVMK